MKKAEHIKPEDLQNLKYDNEGNIIIPEGFEIYIKEDAEEVRLRRIAELEVSINKMTEPTEQELIEMGKMIDPYYEILFELETLKK